MHLISFRGGPIDDSQLWMVKQPSPQDQFPWETPHAIHYYEYAFGYFVWVRAESLACHGK